uniref:Putative ovule protein n=1 Tax=Solanum chacoense TaxID=4108 RepID=A0A0V0HTY5_SOLCH
MTLLTASKKSFSVTVFLLARIAYIPASVHTLLMSAPGTKRTNRMLRSLFVSAYILSTIHFSCDAASSTSV